MIGKFVISGSLISMNDIINTARANRFASAGQKKKEMNRCMMAIIAGRVPTFTTPVKVYFKWIEKNMRRDPDNVSGGGSKILLDSLVELGRLPNDTRRFIKGLFHEFPDPDPLNPRVEIMLEAC